MNLGKTRPVVSLLSCVAFCALSTHSSANSPVLLHNELTGSVRLMPQGANILAFNIQSNGLFNPVFYSPLSDLDVGQLLDNTAFAIGWVSPVAAGGNGFGDRPAHYAGTDIGNIFPVGGFPELTNNQWAGPGGTSGAFLLEDEAASVAVAGGLTGLG